MEKNFSLSISLDEAVQLITDQLNAELVSNKQFRLGDRRVIVLVFNKYFRATQSETALVVTLDNTKGYSYASLIATSGGEGLLRMDWGAENTLIKQVEFILQEKLEFVQLARELTEDESFQSMYFENHNYDDLQKDYFAFLNSNKHITLLDHFEDTIKNENDETLYTIFVTYINN